GNATLNLGLNSAREPDAALTPRDPPQPPPGQGADSNDEPFPTFVFEVGVSESVGSLHDLASQYFGPRTTIRASLAIKVWEARPDGTFAALALLYLRSNAPNTTPAQVISFGTAPIHGNAVNSMPAVIRPLISGFHGPALQVCNGRGL